MGSEAMLVGALACALAVPLLLLGAVYVGVRGSRGPGRDGLGKARALLHARLARGEIELDEYSERESALRSAQAPQRRRVLS